ncbi:chemotaxis protein [Sinorhizobium fredii USDA 205]|uniref:Chemotaxis protein n=1 Tax=Rhizobium fredii TaxID=380 RepID=A0A844AE06_RHIFR|nr:chemotaxis protein MotC [Sinorhizobium fredii]AWM23631.1 Chemotaxis protein motC [Sinorhizobium fredii CCBAU 25509]KSV87288.1 chemotaxis protein [Sinorhizobium fredii USDA 205]MCG5476298.1 chemotaxis protein [Sinorhizobium fredii]MQW94816.1 chemotaxis protein [Sinorhizobium fredii]MQX11414.1 chemotaxis protein [Sinorhizobium fredii]
MLKRLSVILVASVLSAPLAIGLARASETEELAPFKMVRSLQYVQDSVVLGDHSAIEMQRFMLNEIDKRLRAADEAIFRDPRNVDAALVYVMSGGNPETLDYLTDRDVEGNFDARVAEALRQYLRGKGPLIVENLSKAAPEYKNSRVGPYLFLILGNATSQQDPVAAMKYYDWARLTAPGTIIEEAALRRSVSLAVQAGDPEKGFRYALNYARRYLTSPYASQFADVFVELAVTHFDETVEKRVAENLAFMDQSRQREVYLRVARRAAIGGNQTLARLASSRAEELARDGGGQSQLLANFYEGLAAVPSEDVFTAAQTLAAIPDEKLSPRDRALREAARAIAQEVVRLPKDESPAQASMPIPEVDTGPANDGGETGETGSGMSPFVKPADRAPVPGAEPLAGAETVAESDPALDGFMANGRSMIKEIDALLAEEGL